MGQSEPVVLVETEDRITTITLNRPEARMRSVGRSPMRCGMPSAPPETTWTSRQ